MFFLVFFNNFDVFIKKNNKIDNFDLFLTKKTF
jgi:hypothetical protein